LVEALRYPPEVVVSVPDDVTRPLYGPGVDSASDRNK